MAHKRPQKATGGQDTRPTMRDSEQHAEPVSGLPSGFDREAMRAVALSALVRVASAANAPAAAQAQAARSLLEVCGVLGPRAVSDTETKPVSEMTAAEIDAELRALGG